MWLYSRNHTRALTSDRESIQPLTCVSCPMTLSCVRSWVGMHVTVIRWTLQWGSWMNTKKKEQKSKARHLGAEQPWGWQGKWSISLSIYRVFQATFMFSIHQRLPCGNFGRHFLLDHLHIQLFCVLDAYLFLQNFSGINSLPSHGNRSFQVSHYIAFLGVSLAFIGAFPLVQLTLMRTMHVHRQMSIPICWEFNFSV
jgi:hypothetical protein